MYSEEYGKIEKTTIEWRIDDFFPAIETTKSKFDLFFNSPTFSVSHVNWQLRLYPNWTLMDGCLNLFLISEAKRRHSVTYDIALKKYDGSIKQIQSGILDEEFCTKRITLMNKTDLLRLKAVYVPCGKFTIVCTVEKNEDGKSFQPLVFDKTKPKQLIRLDRLSQNFRDLFDNQETCDTTIRLNGKEYKAHRSILIARSKVFAAAFKYDTTEKKTDIITITDCDPDSFQQFLEYLYCGKLEDISIHNAINLYYTSNKYDIEELKSFCIEFLLQSFTVENFCNIIIFADKFDETQLLIKLQDFFNKNSFEIFMTSEWDDLLKKDPRLASKLLKEMSKEKFKKQISVI